MTTTATISVPAPKLRLMLTAVLAHTDPECGLPPISGVRFDYQDGVLYLAGTDRYTLGVARESMPEAAAASIPDQAATLPLEGARELRRILKKRDDKAVVQLAAGKITVTAGEVSGSWAATPPGNAAQGYPTFPDWRELLHGFLTGTQVPMGELAAVDPKKLARLTPGPARAHDSLNVRLLARSETGIPTLVATAGDWFIGALMLVRLGGDENAVATNWADWAEETAPAEKPAPDADAEPASIPEVASA